MKFIDDMKVGRKMIGGFVIVLIILGVISVYAYISINDGAARAKDLYDNRVVCIDQAGKVGNDIRQIRADLQSYLFLPATRTSSLAEIQSSEADIRTQMDAYRVTYLLPEEQSNLSKFDTNYAIFTAEVDKALKAADAGDTKTLNAELADGSSLNAAMANSLDAIEAIRSLNVRVAATDNKEAADAVNAAVLYLSVLTLAGILIGLSVGIYLTKSITGPLEQVSGNLVLLSRGIVTSRVNLSRKDEIGEMADTMDAYAEGLQKNVVAGMQKIARGDLTVSLKVQDEKDEISPALNTINTTLRALIEEVSTLSQAGVEGRLATRGNVDRFRGGYREIVKGLNDTFDSVVTPINEAMTVSGEYAKGNFTARFDEKLEVRGEFVKLKDALNSIGLSISEALQVINRQVGDLTASAEEAQSSVEEVSAGSAQLAKSAGIVNVNAGKATQGTEQILRAMEDLSRTIQDVSTRAEAVSKIVQDTTVLSEEGMNLARKTEQGMQGITKSSQEVNQIILEIKTEMDQISEIVNLITDLANQTNLLALNAAIEAARAGDAGRGFAVVATEVKTLAIESRTSAERIAQRISHLQKETQNAVNVVSASTDGVREGSEALGETLASFGKIAKAIDTINQNISEVAAASEEEAASVEEVTSSINEVNGLMQQTTREATDSATASQESSAAVDQIAKVVENVNAIVANVTREISQFRI